MLETIYKSVYTPAVCIAAAALTIPGILLAAVHELAADASDPAVVGSVWAIALLAMVVLFFRRRRPTSLGTLVALILGLLGSATLVGALHGTVLTAGPVGAALVMFVLAVLATALRADQPRQPRGPRLD